MTAKSGKQARAGKTRVLVVDDHPIVREGLEQLISRQPDMTYCGGVATAAEALKAVATQKPDVAIVDISLGEGCGLDLLKDIRARAPDVLTLVFSMHNKVLYAERAIRAGARGYVAKGGNTNDVLDAIRKIRAGEVCLSPRVNQRILMRLTGGAPDPEDGQVSVLSDRELEVFRMLGEGLKTSQVASALHLSPKTVESHRENIKKKLNVPNGAGLLQAATQWLQRQET